MAGYDDHVDASRTGQPVRQRQAPRPNLRGRYSLFDLLPEAVRQAVLSAAKPQTFQSGQIVYQQGDMGVAMYFVVSGSVRLSFLHPHGRELVLVAYEPGDVFGISSLIDGKPLPHTAEAIGKLELLAVSRRRFDLLRSAHREFGDALLHLLCRHVRLLSDQLTDATLDDLPCRLARRLLHLARSENNGPPQVLLRQAELARSLGVTRQTTNKFLKQFESTGLIGLNYGVVTLRDVAGLTRAASF